MGISLHNWKEISVLDGGSPGLGTPGAEKMLVEGYGLGGYGFPGELGFDAFAAGFAHATGAGGIGEQGGDGLGEVAGELFGVGRGRW